MYSNNNYLIRLQNNSYPTKITFYLLQIIYYFRIQIINYNLSCVQNIKLLKLTPVPVHAARWEYSTTDTRLKERFSVGVKTILLGLLFFFTKRCIDRDHTIYPTSICLGCARAPNSQSCLCEKLTSTARRNK